MFASEAGVWHLSGAPLLGRLQALPDNIRPGWKGLRGTNALAYYKHLLITAVKSFTILSSGAENSVRLKFFDYCLIVATEALTLARFV